MNIIFFGSGSFVLPVIDSLHQNHSLSLVVTTEKQLNDPVPAFCIEKKIPYLSVDSLPNSQLDTAITTIQPQVAVLAAFGLFIPDALLHAFPFGIINIHPSLLPLYRGPTPVQSAIADNATITGVTIIRLDNQLDHGPILAQETVVIDKDETAQILHLRLFEKGAHMLIRILPDYLAHILTPYEQDHTKATYTNRLTREDGYIDISKKINHEKFQQLIKAYFPWPGIWTKISIKNPDGTEKQTRVKFLPNKQIQFEGKKPITYKDLYNGFPTLREIFATVITEKDLFAKAEK